MSQVLKTFNEELVGFINFLMEKNIFQTGIAFIIATQVNKVFLDFIANMVQPVVSNVVNKDIEKQKTNLAGIEFNTGAFSMTVLNFLIVMLFLYYIYKISASSKSFLESFVDKVKNIF